MCARECVRVCRREDGGGGGECALWCGISGCFRGGASSWWGGARCLSSLETRDEIGGQRRGSRRTGLSRFVIPTHFDFEMFFKGKMERTIRKISLKGETGCDRFWIDVPWVPVVDEVCVCRFRAI